MTHHYYLPGIRLNLSVNGQKGLYTVHHKHYDIRDAHELALKNLADPHLKALQDVAERSGWPYSHTVNGLILNAIYAQHKQCSLQALKSFFKHIIAVYPNTYEYNQYYLVFREHYAEHTMLLYKNKGFIHFYHDQFLEAQAYLHHLFTYHASLFPNMCDKTTLFAIAKKHLDDFNHKTLRPVLYNFLSYEDVSIRRDGVGNFYYQDDEHNHLFLGHMLSPEHYPMKPECPSHIHHGLTYHVTRYIQGQNKPSRSRWRHFINSMNEAHSVHPTVKCEDSTTECLYGLRLVYRSMQIHIRQQVGIHFVNVNKGVFHDSELKEIADSLHYIEELMRKYPEWLYALYFKSHTLNARRVGALLMRIHRYEPDMLNHLYMQYLVLKPENIWDFFAHHGKSVNREEVDVWL